MARGTNPIPLHIQQLNSRLVQERGFLEQAILVLFSRQVPDDEQMIARTVHKNNVGFNKSNAKKGSELAQLLMKWQDAKKAGQDVPESPWTSADRMRARDICFTHVHQIHKLLQAHQGE